MSKRCVPRLIPINDLRIDPDQKRKIYFGIAVDPVSTGCYLETVPADLPKIQQTAAGQTVGCARCVSL
jgi:hypothetical protein